MRNKTWFISAKTYSKLEMIYSDDEVIRKANEIGRKRKRIFLLCMMFTIVFSLCSYLRERDTSRKSIESILRNGYGGGDKNVTAIIGYGDYVDEEEITIVVKEKRYTEEELDAYTSSAEESLWDEILGENKSLDEVTTDLKLITNLEGIPYKITWKSEKPLLLSSEGKIDSKRLRNELSDSGEDSVTVKLVATLNYEDRKDDLYGYVSLREDKTKNREKFREKVIEEIDNLGESTRVDDEQILPQEVSGIKISYYPKKKNTGVLILIIGLVVSFGLIIGNSKEIDKEVEVRNAQLREDYPQILNQYVLYYCAGMSHRAIWSAICQRYKSRLEGKAKKRIAYEEMIRCDRSMKEGKGEIVALNDFAKRCQEPCYRVFVSLLEQSVKKGNEGLDIALYEELEKARKEENNRIRMKVQEMSTKLLIPMIMMLLIVLVIVMVPAFVSFK